jgi:hypothetical protein
VRELIFAAALRLRSGSLLTLQAAILQGVSLQAGSLLTESSALQLLLLLLLLMLLLLLLLQQL